MEEKLEYAKQWDVSSKYFYDKDYYLWMCNKLKDYKTVLEIGCGTGYSSLCLLESGHKVIAVDKNIECINKAKELIGENDNITFIKADVAIESFYNEILSGLEFDAVICWNVGSFWNRKTLQFYLPNLLEYGLTTYQIKKDPESSYSELILWNACKIASLKNVPIHIIDRGAEMLDEKNDPYYHALQKEFAFKKIEYDNLKADTISSGGRMLVTKNSVNKEKILDIILISILIK